MKRKSIKSSIKSKVSKLRDSVSKKAPKVGKTKLKHKEAHHREDEEMRHRGHGDY